MRLLDLFAGIGGFSLAAHWMGWETVAFVEKEAFCQRVLRKNFGADIEIHDDIFNFDGRPFRGAVDIITGGFPCQPFSAAGKRKGRADERHLFPEMLRVISEVKPRWVVAENVRGLLSIESGSVFAEVVTSLESEGYEVITFCVPASAVEAPHRRDRLWIVARDRGNDSSRNAENYGSRSIGAVSCGSHTIARGSVDSDASDAEFSGRENLVHGTGTERASGKCGNGNSQPDGWPGHWLEAATRFCRVDDGVSDRVHRLKALGNSIVPQIAFEIFRAIDDAEHSG